MLRRLSCLLLPVRGIKNDLKVTWVRPEYVPAYSPSKSGDLEPAVAVPSETIALQFQQADEIKDAPEAVRKIFSVGHLGGRERNLVVRRQIMERVQRHKYDEMTAESRIARLTGTIRSLQQHMERIPKDVHGKRVCQELIDKRRKLLKFLRRYDYPRFEWLLEKLNIVFKPAPDTLHKLSRKESLRKLTELHCEEVKNKKLSDYRSLLESQQGPFLRNKLDALRTIRSEQAALQVEVTVTEQDIRRVEEALQKWTVQDEIRQNAIKKKRRV